MEPTRRCRCIKDTTVKGVEIGGIYKFRDCVAEKVVWTNETDTTYEPLFCNADYFYEHFEVV